MIRRRRYAGVSYTGARASAGVKADDKVQVTHTRPRNQRGNAEEAGT